MEGNILVTGSTGAIGRKLVLELRNKYGQDRVIAGYNRRVPEEPMEKIDLSNKDDLNRIVTDRKITSIYHLAALLSVAAEKNPAAAEELNTGGLRNVLEVMAEQVQKGNNMTGFWASSIGVYGNVMPPDNVVEDVDLKPITVYGKGKVVGEKLIKEYYDRHGVDMRIIRFPGLNGPGKPGPGTTEYAIHMIQAAVNDNNYTVPLKHDTTMPMMDMRDAVLGIMKLMVAPSDKIDVASPYNIAALSFHPKKLAEVVKEFNKLFTVEYSPDEDMQGTADSWPNSINDSRAREHWGWEPKIDLPEMVRNIFEEAKKEM